MGAYGYGTNGAIDKWLDSKRATPGPHTENQPQKGRTMNYEAIADRVTLNQWRVEAINHAGEGECFVTIFSGPDAEIRAKEYATWKNS